MLSNNQLMSLKKQFSLTIKRLLPGTKDEDLDSLAECLAAMVDRDQLMPRPLALFDDTPDIDLNGEPLDTPLPPTDPGEWLDHSPIHVDGGQPGYIMPPKIDFFGPE
jgi:hypothetical protein